MRVGTLADSDLAARRLTMLREVTAASPSYVQARGVPGSIDALQDGHQMVGYRSSATGQLIPLEFQQAGQIRYVPLPARVTVSGADAFLGAALAGLGIIQAPRYRMAPYIARGQLVELLPDAPPTPSPLNLVYPRNRTPSPRLRVFIDWVAGMFDLAGNCNTLGVPRLPASGRYYGAAALGSTSSNTVPVSSEVTLTVPPWACAIARVIARPSPAPSWRPRSPR